MLDYTRLLRQVREEFARSPKSSAAWDAGNAFTGRFIYRPLGILLAPIFIGLSISANLVTLLSFLVGLAGLGTFLLGDASWFLVGALCYFAFAVLDFTDGLVARHERKSTHFGKMIDHMSGVIVSAPAPLFVGYGVALAGLVPDWLGSVALYLMLASLASVVNLTHKELSTSFALERARVSNPGAATKPEASKPEDGTGPLYAIRRLVFHATSTTAQLVLIALVLLDLVYLYPVLLLGLASIKLIAVLAEILRRGPQLLAIEKA